MTIPFDANKLSLRAVIVSDAPGDHSLARALVARLQARLDSGEARLRLADFMGATLTDARLGSFVGKALEVGSPGLLEARLEQVDPNGAHLRVDVLKPQALRDALIADAKLIEANAEDLWPVRALNWLSRKLLGEESYKEFNDEEAAKARAEHIHITASTLFVLLLNAVAVEIDTMAREEGTQVSFFLMCPGAPNPTTTLNVANAKALLGERDSGPARGILAA